MNAKQQNTASLTCLLCGESAEPQDKGKRGLCKTHYEAFRRAVGEVEEEAGIEAADKMDAEAVASGRILKSSRGRSKKKPPNPFSDLMRKYLEKKKPQ